MLKRKKLEKKFGNVGQILKKRSPEALQEKIEEIHRWIARNATHRIHFENKNIALFDENQNPAKTSQRVKIIAKKLNDDMQCMYGAIRMEKSEQL